MPHALVGKPVSSWSNIANFRRYRRLQSKPSLSPGSIVTPAALLAFANVCSWRRLRCNVGDRARSPDRRAFGSSVRRRRRRKRTESAGAGQLVYVYEGLSVAQRTVNAEEEFVVDRVYLENVLHKLNSLESALQEQRGTSAKLNARLEQLQQSKAIEHGELSRAVEDISSLRSQIYSDKVELWSSVRSASQFELANIRRDHRSLEQEINSVLHTFSISSLYDTVSKAAPRLSQLIQSLEVPAEKDALLHSVRGTTVMAILARRGDNRFQGLQLVISLMLFARAVGRNVITSLNHIGVAMSYTPTLDWLRKAADDVSRSVNFREGRWMLVFDNVNFQKKNPS